MLPCWVLQIMTSSTNPLSGSSLACLLAFSSHCLPSSLYTLEHTVVSASGMQQQRWAANLMEDLQCAIQTTITLQAGFVTHCNMCASTESVVLCTTQRLRGQVSSLKASRDKLLVEVDRQSLEIERLLTDNSALEQVPNTYPGTYVHLSCAQAWTSALEVLAFCQ